MTYDPDDGQTCRCVAGHRPGPMVLNAHHVWPISAGGPDVAANRVWVCHSSHDSIHILLAEMLRQGRRLTYGECQVIFDDPVNHYCHGIAVLGYDRIQRRAL